MVDVDIDSFLQKGYWPNSRARSPDSRLLRTNTPSSRSSYVDVFVPRRLPSYRPPPPKVEDESVAVAKEYGSEVSFVPGEEPLYRGDVEQYPILLPVHEHNPERRFVLVPTPSDSADDSSDGVKKLPRRPKSRGPPPDPEPTSYEANTCRRRPKNEEDHEKKEPEKKRDTGPTREKHRSKLDHLPAIVTDVNTPPRSPDKRPKSTARSERGGDDYFSPRLNSRLQNGNTLSPDVIEHGSKGRERGYYHGGTSPYTQDRNRSSHPNAQYEKSPRDDRRHKDKNTTSTKPPSPTHQKRRSTADLPQQLKSPSKVDREKGRQYTEPRSPGIDRNSYSRSERDNTSQVSSGSGGKRASPPNSEYYYSSDEEGRRRHHAHRRHESETKAYLGTPTDLKPSDKRRSRASSPLPSPRVSQVYEKDYVPSPSPRSSTFPKDIRFSRSEQRTQPPPSRTSTGKLVLNAAAPLAVAAAAAVAAATRPASPPVSHRQPAVRPPSRAGSIQTELPPVSHRQSVVRPPSRGGSLQAEPSPATHRLPAVRPPSRAGSLQAELPPVSHRQSTVRPPSRTGPLQTEPRSSAPKLSSSPQRQARQPIDSSPLREVSHAELPILTNRRYLDEIRAGRLPDMQYCPRRKAIAGCVDWLTLPRCDNFNICPSCYDVAFADTEFAHHFVPMPFRPADRPIACDFGTSRFYHIAYFLMSKHRKADLSLFRSIANIGTQGQPCAGPREITRTWFSVRDPRSARPVESFTVCASCAKTMEQLLPNLTGIFVPVESPAEPTRGVCAMQQQRERFAHYLDVLEAASDKALLAQSAPDVQALADRIRAMAAVPECAGSLPVTDARWYTMLSLPDFTVCEECFGGVVWPMIQSDSRSVAANFLQSPERRALAACQLYSPRMRRVFAEAVRTGDVRYLAAKLRERDEKEQEFHARVVGLEREILGDAFVDIEVERAKREWALWE
ncbi:hypothetical protein GGR53DRAFT_86953 [Hypoxylon sp. FL1150]|nr:hypothetical protein GGR53DRAFT_86953 [Hypoxylon sp. FL1150]